MEPFDIEPGDQPGNVVGIWDRFGNLTTAGALTVRGGATITGPVTAAGGRPVAAGPPAYTDPYGLLFSSWDIILNSAQLQPGSGTLLLQLCEPGAGTLTNLGLWMTVTGNTPSGVNQMAVYSSTGTLLSSSADMSAAWSGATGWIPAPMTPVITTAANTPYYFAILGHMGVAMPKFAGTASAGATFPPVGPAALVPGLFLGAQASIPASVNIGALSANNGGFWFTAS